jgi:hypothetical protein
VRGTPWLIREPHLHAAHGELVEFPACGPGTSVIWFTLTDKMAHVSQSFIRDLNARIREAEQIISEQNENLSALRHLLAKEMGNQTPAPVTPPPNGDALLELSSIDFKGRTSDIILALVHRSGKNGTRPRDIAATLLEHKLMGKGSNAVHSHLSELKKKGLVRQNSEGFYVGSSKPATVEPNAVSVVPAKAAKKKRKMSAAGREAIRKAQKARWAAVQKSK